MPAATRASLSRAANDDDDENFGEDSAGGCVSHGLYRDIIAEGFDKSSMSRLAPNKPAYFPIDDPVTRTLATSKYPAKAQEYCITVANASFASVTRAAQDDAIAAANEGYQNSSLYLLTQVSNNMAAWLRGHASRSDDIPRPHVRPHLFNRGARFRPHFLKNEFTRGVQNKGGSARSNKFYAAYQV